MVPLKKCKEAAVGSRVTGKWWEVSLESGKGQIMSAMVRTLPFALSEMGAMGGDVSRGEM